MVVRIGQKGRRPRRVWFREWREHRGLTQDQVAARLDTNKSAISKMELGKTKYNQSSLEAWAEALNCEPAQLLRGPPDTQEAQAPAKSEMFELFEKADEKTRKIVETILKVANA